MKKWEYTCCRKLSELDPLGKDGWELVCVDATNFYLKREIK